MVVGDRVATLGVVVPVMVAVGLLDDVTVRVPDRVPDVVSVVEGVLPAVWVAVVEAVSVVVVEGEEVTVGVHVEESVAGGVPVPVIDGV